MAKPLAIAMWDFSWLERRWPGAGYEDWDRALDELIERGYDAVRIDAYPHFIAADAVKTWTVLPVWNQQTWGSPALNRVRVQPALNEFIAKCRKRNVRVALSTWFREDPQQTRMTLTSPQKLADAWIETIESIAAAGLTDALLYIDLCNEWLGELWAPFFINDPPELTWAGWHTQKSIDFMRASLARVRRRFPELPLCYSFTGGDPALYAQRDLSFFDLIEHHIWLAQLNDGEFDKAVGYTYDRFSPDAYNRLALRCGRVYFERPHYWQNRLVEGIEHVAQGARAAALPLITTECWALVDFKDWPLLDWNIVKELCEIGVRTAAKTGQWAAIATSNFCGPQFVGMWRDIEWHRRLTDIIHNAPLDPSLLNHVNAQKLLNRLQVTS